MIRLATSTKTEKANFLLRLGAFLIDIVILGIASNILFAATGDYNGQNLLSTLISLAYFVAMDVKYGATLGKKALKLRVVDAKTGANLTWISAILREFVGRLVNSLTLGIGYLWVLWDKDKQGLHDKIGGSYVVKQG